jgi:hypothetical protein
VKLRSASNRDVLNELQFVLSQKGTPSARVTLREANRRHRELSNYCLRLLRAADRGAFDATIAPCPPTDAYVEAEAK